jgi:serine/threonine protein phosphatase 1
MKFVLATPTLYYNVFLAIQGCNVWNIDFKGKLSIINIETKEYWQSEPVWELYANEVGRNK